jgi:hypothetical protein
MAKVRITLEIDAAHVQKVLESLKVLGVVAKVAMNATLIEPLLETEPIAKSASVNSIVAVDYPVDDGGMEPPPPKCMKNGKETGPVGRGIFLPYRSVGSGVF